MKLGGSDDLGLQEWKMPGTSKIDARLRLQNVALSRLLSESGRSDIPVEGTLSADVVLQGTVDDPAGVVQVMVVNPSAYGEKPDRFRAEVRYRGNILQVLNGQLEAGAGRVLISGAYHHAAGDWKNGQVHFDLSTRNLMLGQIRAVRDGRPGTNGKLEASAKGTATVQNGEVLPAVLAGRVSLTSLVADDRSLGDLEVDATTANEVLTLKAKGNLRGSQVTGNARFELTGDYQGRGEVAFTPMALSVIQDFASASRSGKPMPFDGVVEGRITFAGPARKPGEMTARIELPTLEMVPSRPARNRDQQRDLALRNQGPVVAELDAKGIHFRSAKFVGTDTNLEIAGTVSTQGKNPWDVRVNGTLNLGVLEEFNSDLITSGVTTVNATIRGSLQQPQLLGRLDLKNASLYMTDVPNGLDQVNGVIVFDPNRATIEKITGATGGGRITLSGFVSYGKGEPTFRLQGRADGVRIRNAEGISTSANAALDLAGSRRHSVLSGTVTVLRAVFNPKTDLGSLIAGAAKPVAAPSTPNPYLREMYLDVRVESVPNLVFQSALSSNIQAEADLRIRGTAAKPAVLGRVTINQGEIQFFGNKYQINRGEIGFYNPARIEPSLNMDLETKVRGVTVNISFTGMLPNKLNFSYRSDPPLQSNEIVALLAVGRDPTSSGGLGSAQTQSQATGAFSCSKRRRKAGRT
jgi:translocation and assembly module TamB